MKFEIFHFVQDDNQLDTYLHKSSENNVISSFYPKNIEA